MTYPKPFMRKSELMNMGFPEKLLDRAYMARGQTFAQKINPSKHNSPLVFDTEGFEKWRLEQIQIEQKAMKLRGGVM